MFKLNYIALAFAIISFLSYVFFNKNISFKSIRYFIVFLFCMFFFDVIGVVFFKYGLNNAFYNLMVLLEFNVLFLFYRDISQNSLTKKIIKIFTVLYNVILFCSSFYYGKAIFSTKYNTIAPVFGAVFIGIVLMLYLREFLLSEKVLNYKKNVFFWITTGLLLYYIGTMPLTAIVNFLKTGNVFLTLYKIQHLLTIVMHVCFLTGLIWSWKRVR